MTLDGISWDFVAGQRDQEGVDKSLTPGTPRERWAFSAVESGRWSVRRPVSRVLSGVIPPLGDHSSGPVIADRIERHTRMAGRGGAPCARKARTAIPTRSCSGRGLPCLSHCWASGGLLPHPFILTRGWRGRFSFCGAFPRLAPAGCYPAPCRHGARTFLEAPRRPAAARPSDGSELRAPSGLVKRAPCG